MTSTATTASAGTFKSLTIREAAVLLALAWLVPFLVHLVPWAGARPLGAYLLPAFWATFVAVYFYGATAGLLTGLIVPAINLAVTGLPAWRSFGNTAVEMVVFVLAATWAVRSAPRFWLWAPLAYVAAKLVASLTVAYAVTTSRPDAAAYFFTHLVMGNGAGLAALAVINVALAKYFPKTPEASAAR